MSAHTDRKGWLFKGWLYRDISQVVGLTEVVNVWIVQCWANVLVHKPLLRSGVGVVGPPEAGSSVPQGTSSGLPGSPGWYGMNRSRTARHALPSLVRSHPLSESTSNCCGGLEGRHLYTSVFAGTLPAMAWPANCRQAA